MINYRQLPIDYLRSQRTPSRDRLQSASSAASLNLVRSSTVVSFVLISGCLDVRSDCAESHRYTSCRAERSALALIWLRRHKLTPAIEPAISSSLQTPSGVQTLFAIYPHNKYPQNCDTLVPICSRWLALFKDQTCLQRKPWSGCVQWTLEALSSQIWIFLSSIFAASAINSATKL